MNQLQTRSAAPFASVLPAASGAKDFSLKKINVVKDALCLLVGKWRLYCNYCPECNSCAPKIHHCEVCNADTKSHFHWTKNIEQAWWKKYMAKHRIAL